MPTPTPNPFDVDALVFSSQEGDKVAFGELYELFFEPIYRYIYFRVPALEVDDLVEMVFIKAWMNLEKYEKRDAQFSSWLFRIAHNAVIDYRRQHRSIAQIDENLEDQTEDSAPKRLTEKTMLSQTVREAIDQLKDPYKQVVTLKFLIGLSNAEIAEVMREREGNVRVLQFRALKELKEILAAKGLKKEFL
jgi:RNA polymerase sigma-70 factor, ECF subfamily